MSVIVKRHLLPMGLRVGEQLPRRAESPWVSGGVGVDTLRAFAHQEAGAHVAACETAATTTCALERARAVTAARAHFARLADLNLQIRLRGGLPVVEPAIRLL